MDINSFVIGLAKGKKSGYFSTKENDAGGLTYAFKAKESEGGGSLEGFHMVRFFNDDQTTLLYTVFVPDGASAIYAGETPVSTENQARVFAGFEPLASNVTADLDCYAVYDDAVTSFADSTWEHISTLSQAGLAENYFSVGDMKAVSLNGKMGEDTLSGTYYAYIIGINHNSEIEGAGIHMRIMMTAEAKALAFCYVGSSGGIFVDGSKVHNMNHWGRANYGGWAGCDMRYDMLGSTDKAPTGYGQMASDGRVGYDASSTCATRPVPDTLMAALPVDLRMVMKPMIKYTDNVGGGTNAEGAVTATVDYLPLPSAFEVFGDASNSVLNSKNPYEASKQKQYAFFVNGGTKVLYRRLSKNNAVEWFLRSPMNNSAQFMGVATSGGASSYNADVRYGYSPIFKV